MTQAMMIMLEKMISLEREWRLKLGRFQQAAGALALALQRVKYYMIYSQTIL